MSAIWESTNWTRQFGIRQTGNRQFGMLPHSRTGLTDSVLSDNRFFFFKSPEISPNKQSQNANLSRVFTKFNLVC